MNKQTLTLNYQSALKSLEDFGGSTIPLENITIDWLKRCEKILDIRR